MNWKSLFTDKESKFACVIIAFLLAGVTLAIAGVGWSYAGVILMAGAGSLAVGAFFGFLFGIPRMLQASPAASPDAAPGSGAEKKQVWASSNSNLERISDWLTAAIIGATLVQLQNIATGLDWLARTVSAGITLAGETAPVAAAGAGAAANAATLGSPTGYAVAYFAILYFFMGGFLLAYLFTRINILVWFNSVEGELREKEKRAANESVQQLLTEVRRPIPTGSASHSTAGTITTAEAKAEAQAEANTAAAGEEDAPDANRGKFGGKYLSNGRKLSAKITPTSPEYCQVELKVEGLPGYPPLDSPVTFHLHETFQPSQATIHPLENIAALTFEAWGGDFVVGVIADHGRTLLELDLADESWGGPEAWRNR